MNRRPHARRSTHDQPSTVSTTFWRCSAMLEAARRPYAARHGVARTICGWAAGAILRRADRNGRVRGQWLAVHWRGSNIRSLSFPLTQQFTHARRNASPSRFSSHLELTCREGTGPPERGVAWRPGSWCVLPTTWIYRCRSRWSHPIRSIYRPSSIACLSLSLRSRAPAPHIAHSVPRMMSMRMNFERELWVTVWRRYHRSAF
ncbi:hypothetical protein BV20DRAFT_960915 [Pilatotrama ljubarskyi]|nr:hypothetical protein BV20DRAFT_960915 [Pilatotrama ljubarskyi]